MKSFKKLFLALCVLVFVLSVNTFAYSMNVRVIVDGKVIESSETGQNEATGFISSDRTFVPLRLIGENLNCTVKYDEATKDILITSDDLNIKMNVNSKDFAVNGENKSMDVVPIIYKDRTYIPIRYIGEAFGKEVSWDKDSYTCIVGGVGEINLESLKKLSQKFDENYKIYTFGNPKVTVKIPMELSKELVVEDDNYGINIYEAISYDDDEKSNGFMMSVFQLDSDSYKDMMETFGIDKVLDIKGNFYVAVDYLKFQDLEEIYEPLVKTPHYRDLVDKLNKGMIVTQENPSNEVKKYKIYTFGKPKVNVKIPRDLLDDLSVIQKEAGYDDGIRIYNNAEYFGETKRKFYYAVEQFEDPKFDPNRTRSELVNKTGNTITVKYDTKYIENGEDPIYDRLCKEIIVEMAK